MTGCPFHSPLIGRAGGILSREVKERGYRGGREKVRREISKGRKKRERIRKK